MSGTEMSFPIVGEGAPWVYGESVAGVECSVVLGAIMCGRAEDCWQIWLGKVRIVSSTGRQ